MWWCQRWGGVEASSNHIHPHPSNDFILKVIKRGRLAEHRRTLYLQAPSWFHCFCFSSRALIGWSSVSSRSVCSYFYPRCQKHPRVHGMWKHTLRFVDMNDQQQFAQPLNPLWILIQITPRIYQDWSWVKITSVDIFMLIVLHLDVSTLSSNVLRRSTIWNTNRFRDP